MHLWRLHSWETSSEDATSLERLMSLTCRGKQSGEEQQARYPRLELHPKLVSPRDAFLRTGLTHQQRKEMTETDFCLALSSFSGTGSGEALLCQVTHIIYAYKSSLRTWTRRFNTHMETEICFLFMSVVLFFLMFCQRVNLKNPNLHPTRVPEGLLFFIFNVCRLKTLDKFVICLGVPSTML